MNQWEAECLSLHEDLINCLENPHNRPSQEIESLLERIFQTGDYSYFEKMERILNFRLNNGHSNSEEDIKLVKRFLLKRFENFEEKASIFSVLSSLERKCPQLSRELSKELKKTMEKFLEE